MPCTHNNVIDPEEDSNSNDIGIGSVGIVNVEFVLQSPHYALDRVYKMCIGYASTCTARKGGCGHDVFKMFVSWGASSELFEFEMGDGCSLDPIMRTYGELPRTRTPPILPISQMHPVSHPDSIDSSNNGIDASWNSDSVTIRPHLLTTKVTLFLCLLSHAKSKITSSARYDDERREDDGAGANINQSIFT